MRRLAGFFREAHLSAVVCAFLTVCLVVLSFNLFDKSIYANKDRVEYLYTHPYDKWTYLVHQVWRTNNLTGEKLLFLGPSSFREGIGTQEVLELEFTKRGSLVKPVKMASSGQTLAETYRAVTAIKDPDSVTLILGTNYVRLSARLDDPKDVCSRPWGIPYSSEVCGYAGVSQIQVASSFLTFNQLMFQMKRKKDKQGRFSKLAKKISYYDHVYDEETPFGKYRKKEFKQTIIEQYHPEYLDRHQKNIKLYRELLAYAHKNFKKVVLVELPSTPYIRNTNQEILKDYQPRMRELAREFNIPYLEFMWELPLEESHFYDFSHLRPDGRMIFQNALLDELKKVGVM